MLSLPVIAAAVGLYLLLNLFAFLISDRLLFRPRPLDYEALPDEIKIPTAGGEQLSAVWLKKADAEYTLLFCHGNAENLDTVLPFMEQFVQLGYSVLLFDYRGYGLSDGRPSTRRAKQDVLAAYRWLTDEQGMAPETIVAHGRSLGGAVAVWLAARRRVGALVVESSFTSAFRVKTRWPLLPWDKFNSLRLIQRVNCPLLIMHGTHDTVLPFWHGKKLYQAAKEPKQYLWIDGGEHNDYVYVAGEDYLASFTAFMQSVRSRSAHQEITTPK